jgi:protein-disulfide isomerase
MAMPDETTNGRPPRPPLRTFYTLLAGAAAIGFVWVALAARPHARIAVADAVPYDTALARSAAGYRYGGDAGVEIVEFADFECPGCAQFAARDEPRIRRLLVDSGRASFVFMDFPLAKHANSLAAHNAAACADAQHGFWAMHDRLYASQGEWNAEATPTPRVVFARLAHAIGLDTAAWSRCVDARTYERRIEANRAAGLRAGVSGTPTIVVGGRPFIGLHFEQLAAMVDSITAAGRARTAP